MHIDTEHTLQQVLEDHKLWIEDVGGSRADLSGANLSGTQYEKDIPVIINTEYYSIVKCKAYIKIGCETHTPEEWREFNDTQIQEMDGEKALLFWKKYKTLVLLPVGDDL